MMNNNKFYKGETFSGKTNSFEKDLTGYIFEDCTLNEADFSGCDLRGTTFLNSDLTNSSFLGAKIGITRKAKLTLFLIQAILGGLSGMLTVAGNFFVSAFLIKDILTKFGVASSESALFLMFCFALCSITTIVVAVKNNRYEYLIKFLAVYFGLAIAVTITLTYNQEMGEIVKAVVVSAIVESFVGFILIAFAIVLAGIGGASASMIFGCIIGFAMTVVLALIQLSGNETQVQVSSLGLSSFLFIIIIYLTRRAMEREELQLSFLRKPSLNLSCLFGTRFDSSILKNIDFGELDLKYVSFKNTKIISNYPPT